MKAETVEYLRQLNNRFYAENAASFSATRTSSWDGWERCLPHIEQLAADADSSGLRVLDMACGNLRFEGFLQQRMAQVPVTAYAVDACVDLVECLVPDAGDVYFQELDIVGALASGGLFADALEAPICDVAVCFGFMHHVPGFDARCALVRAMLEKLRPGGVACVSFWQFMNDTAFAEKAAAHHGEALAELASDVAFDAADLEPGDMVLGWQGRPGAHRYCHHFDGGEIDKLLAFVCEGGRATVIDRFAADGKSGQMNAYAVLRKAM